MLAYLSGLWNRAKTTRTMLTNHSQRSFSRPHAPYRGGSKPGIFRPRSGEVYHTTPTPLSPTSDNASDSEDARLSVSRWQREAFDDDGEDDPTGEWSEVGREWSKAKGWSIAFLLSLAVWALVAIGFWFLA